MLKSVSKALPLALTGLIMISACGKQSAGGEEVKPLALNTLPLPVISGDQGIYPSKSILDDLHNPFRSAPLYDNLGWDVTNWSNADITTGASARFYAWATLLAKGGDAERQVQVANAYLELSKLTTADEDQKNVYKLMAIKAYQSQLDNFPDGKHYEPTYSYRLAPWSYNQIKELGGTVLGNWIEVYDTDHLVTVIKGQ